ncbi:MAG: acyl-CoA dehydrogenase [Deltaproteobacteria bacterium]|nr:acyl-CoA dehydrogenase [Deltaproteobacteria bacterium]
MDLRFNKDQQMIRDTVRRFLEGECSRTLVRELEASEQGFSPELWRGMAELGLMGVAFPEDYGGLAKGFQELCIAVEEQGRYRLACPYVPTVVLCGMSIACFGTEEQKREYLRSIAAGQRIMTYAVSEPGAVWEPSESRMAAERGNGIYTLNGRKIFVPYAVVADEMLVVARTDLDGKQGLTLFLVDSGDRGIAARRMKTLGPEHQYDVLFRDVKVPEGRILGRQGEGGAIAEAISQWGAAAKCAEMVGGAGKVLEMSVEYAKERVQFGKPIGSFQAVQHHCANMAVDLDGARFIAYEAIWRLAEGLDSITEVSMAKAWVSDAYRRICALAHRIHGAVGFTMEHDMQLYTRHAKECEVAFGDGDWHRGRVAGLIGL